MAANGRAATLQPGKPPEGEVPENANEHCPGTESENAGKSSACQGCPNQEACKSAPKGPDPDLALINERLATVKRKVLVLSGKGGVGKSTVASQLAFALADEGNEVGLLDIDICGPSVPKMLGLEGEEVHQSNFGWEPVHFSENLSVMSIGFMLPNPDSAVVWRGPRKNGLIKQFLKDVDWGEVDVLLIDTPPGTSDEHISAAQYLGAVGADGAVIVTTPQEVACADVRKELSFCSKTSIPVLGIVENMAEMQTPLRQLELRDARTGANVTDRIMDAVREKCPELEGCYAISSVFPSSQGGAKTMADRYGTRVLARLPMDPEVCRACERGKPLKDGGPSSLVVRSMAREVSSSLGLGGDQDGDAMEE